MKGRIVVSRTAAGVDVVAFVAVEFVVVVASVDVAFVDVVAFVAVEFVVVVASVDVAFVDVVAVFVDVAFVVAELPVAVRRCRR